MRALWLSFLLASACGDDDSHTVLPCESVGAAGTWENITPAEVHLEGSFDTPAGQNYGVHSFVLDPRTTGQLYLGTSAQGIYKTADCGATWAKVNTGENGDVMDGGRQWTFQIDRDDPEVMYTNTGYGTGGAWKSTNGGVDWQPLVDPAYARALQFGGFVQYIRMDPTNSRHVLVTPHFECEIGQGPGGAPQTKGCILETKDAGATWRILEGAPPAGEGSSQWMLDADTWFWSAYFDGMWRTTNGGASWEQVVDRGTYSTTHGVRAANGTFFTGGVFTTLTSTDGGATWTDIEGSPGTELLATDGTRIFGARGAYYGTASVDAPGSWTQLPTPDFADANNVLTWDLQYDADHHILYSLNATNGFWRLVLE